MENIIRDIADTKEDLHDIRARISENKRDASRATNIRSLFDDTEEYIESLLDALVKATEAFDTIADDVMLAEYSLENIITAVEREQLSARIAAM